MKKIFLSLLNFSVIAFLVSCGPGEKPKSNVAPGMMELDLSAYNMPVTIIVPDSTRGIVEITTQPTGETFIKVGKEFQISVIEDAGDIETEKNDVKIYNEVKKLKRYITDEPTTVVYEQEIPGAKNTEYHFYTIVKTTANTTYVVKDVREDTYGENAINAMLESAKSIKPKGTDAKIN